MSDSKREVLWRTWDSDAMEYLRLLPTQGRSQVAESLIIGVNAGKPFQIRYQVELESRFKVRSFELEVGEDGEDFRAAMYHEITGQWVDANSILPEFDACEYIDITATPFTNTLPIRHLKLKKGESADINVVYVNPFERTVTPEMQRYTCLSPNLYHFEMPSIDFSADIPVDDDGFVLDYPDLFRRVWPRP